MWRLHGPSQSAHEFPIRDVERDDAQKHGWDCPATKSALDDIQGKAGKAGLFVARLHIQARQVHGADDLIERYLVCLGLVERDARCMYGLRGSHGVAFDTGNLDEATDGIASHAEVVLHGDFRGVLHLSIGSTERRGQSAGSHGAGHAYFTLAANLRAADRSILLI